jgi:hypothetical protein
MLSLTWAASSAVGLTFPNTKGENNSNVYGSLYFQAPGVYQNNSGSVILADFVHPNDTATSAVSVYNNSATYSQFLQIDADVPAALNSFLLNTTLSLLVDDPDHRFVQYITQECSVTSYVQVYKYDQWVLRRSYLAPLVVTFLIGALGVACVARGEQSGASFLDFAKTLEGSNIIGQTQGKPDVKVLLKSGVSATSSYGFSLFKA